MPAASRRCDDRAMLTHKAVTSEDLPGRARLRMVGARKFYGRAGDRIAALDGVSLEFLPGTFTAIMGPSGSGKSTLLQCAAGLDRLDEGSVALAGVDPARASETALARLRRHQVGFIFQSFNLLPSLTARQNVELPLRLAGRRPDPRSVAAVLGDLGLSDRAGHLPSELSGGQQQRVAIARALITRPSVVFADEPTGALDTRTSREVLALLRRMVTDHGLTVCMVTHDPVAAGYADRVVFLSDGRIVDQLDRPGAPEIAARMAGLEPDGAPSC
jgi:putative ABC transport system ATP-binding protein